MKKLFLLVKPLINQVIFSAFIILIVGSIYCILVEGERLNLELLHKLIRSPIIWINFILLVYLRVSSSSRLRQNR